MAPVVAEQMLPSNVFLGSQDQNYQPPFHTYSQPCRFMLGYVTLQDTVYANITVLT